VILPDQVQLNHVVAVEKETGKMLALGMVLATFLVIAVIIVSKKMKG